MSQATVPRGKSDDVLEAVQRMRARADAMGNLPSNEAQTVAVEGDSISIVPTNVEVIYVPTYDSHAVYTTAATSPPIVVEATSDGFSTGTLVTTRLLSFGAGILVNEIFDDDDNWHDYWGPSYARPIGWKSGYVRPRPPGWRHDVDIEFDRDLIDIDNDGNWRPDRDRRERAREKIADRHPAADGSRPDRAGRDDGGRAS